MDYLELALLVLMSVLLRPVELARKISGIRPAARSLMDAKIIYETLYVHGMLGLAALGVVWERTSGTQGTGGNGFTICVVAVLMVGCFFRGFASDHNPQVASIKDPDFRYGLVIPNTIGLSGLIFVLLAV